MPARLTAKMAVLLFSPIAPISNFGAAKDRSVSPQLAGYKAVRVHYGPHEQNDHVGPNQRPAREFAG